MAQSSPRLSTSIEIAPSALMTPDIGDLAVIDRFDEARVDQTSVEKGAAPFRDRHMHHIGHDVDTGHETAAKAEPARHLVVVHLVFGLFGGVVGLDAVGFDQACHRPVPICL